MRHDARVRVRAALDAAHQHAGQAAGRRRTWRGRSPCPRRRAGPAGCRPRASARSGRPCAVMPRSPLASRRRRRARRGRSCRSRCSGRGCRRASSAPRLRSGSGCGRAAPWPRPGRPGVQKPHCNAACSRNLRCSGCSASPLRQPLDGGDAGALGLGGQHQAGVHQPAVEDDAAGAAIAGAAAFLGAGEPELVAQHVEQRLLRLAQELDGLAVDGGGDVHACFIGGPPRAGRRWRRRAGRARRRPWCGSAMVPRLSSIGRQAARAAAARAASVGVVEPGADQRRGGLGAPAAASAPPRRARRAPAAKVPSAASVRLTPQPTTAMSISVRGVSRR